MSGHHKDTDAASVLYAEDVAGTASAWQLPVFERDVPANDPPTAQALEEIEAAAYQDGFQRGQAEGFAAGQQAVLQQAQRLQALVEHAARPLAHLDDEVERALVELAAAIARRVVVAELKTDPERIVTMAREALAALPPQLRRIHLQVNPADVELLKAQLAAPLEAQTFEIVANPELGPGDCRLVTESALIDGSIENRVRAVAQSLTGDGE